MFPARWLLVLVWTQSYWQETDVWHGELFGIGCFYIQVYLGYEHITLSIHYQFPTHPSFPYHLLRLRNHLFVLSGNFTSQGLDQIGISTQER